MIDISLYKDDNERLKSFLIDELNKDGWVDKFCIKWTDEEYLFFKDEEFVKQRAIFNPAGGFYNKDIIEDLVKNVLLSNIDNIIRWISHPASRYCFIYESSENIGYFYQKYDSDRIDTNKMIVHLRKSRLIGGNEEIFISLAMPVQLDFGLINGEVEEQF